MVEGIYYGESRCAIQSASVVECGCDADGGFVGARDAEVDLSHDGGVAYMFVRGLPMIPKR